MAMNRYAKWLGGAAALLVAGAAAYYAQERSVEQPDYQTEERDGRFELRRYSALLVAETWATGERAAALNQGFRRLADYIFAKSRGGESIAMTAPVLSDRGEKIAMTAPVLSDAGGWGWRTRFVMPSRFTRETLPPPPEGVAIESVAPRRVAAMRFAGSPDSAVLARREGELRDWIAARGLRGGAVEYAFYNSPFVPGPLRRNEVLIPLEK